MATVVARLSLPVNKNGLSLSPCEINQKDVNRVSFLSVRADGFEKRPAHSQPDIALVSETEGGEAVKVTRRLGLGLAAVSVATQTLLWSEGGAMAVTSSGAVAGRIPGLSDPDAEGLRTYKRPEGKSGGHGVGWSEMIPYSFKVPSDWEEVPVSIADLGGTEIDLRFSSKLAGNISVVVAPCLRFSDRIGNNAKIEDVGTPEQVISAFGPEITGQNVEGKVKDQLVKEVQGRKYYQYELTVPHMLVSATAAGNRLYIFSVAANGRQWKKSEDSLRGIANSFQVL